MAAELELDLIAAAEDGVTAEAYVGPDVRGFATLWAKERGAIRPRLRLGLTILAALVGAIPGVALALFVAYGLSSEAMAAILSDNMIRVGENAYRPYFEPPEWLLPPLYALGAVFAYLGSVAAVGAVLYWRLDSALTRTLRALAITLPPATGAAIGTSVLYAWVHRFSTHRAFVFGEVFAAAAVFLSSVGVTRTVAVMRERAVG
jgi:hypothetical protein